MRVSIRGGRLVVAAVAALMLSLGAAEVAQAQTPAPPGAIDGQYIVVLKRDVGAEDALSIRAEALARGAQLRHVYQAALNGFAARLPAQAVEALRRHPRVDFIEPDTVVTADDTQSGAPWGLDRIDQRALPLNSAYTYGATGSGVKAYIVDTGIRSTHVQFGGRVTSGYTAISDGRGTSDCAGHGTHVAGTVGGSTSGVAKQVSLVAVRVLGCDGSGSTSGVIAGIDWVTNDHQAGQPAVANLSLGSDPSSSLDTAVRNSIADGVTYAIAAGNDNASACNYSPGRVDAAITVGSTTSTDGRSSFSNWGTCLDTFAPGSSITSTMNGSDTATGTKSGTSMATPHVAGVAATYLQGNPSASPTSVRDAIVNSATPNVVTSPGSGSPNRLLYASAPTTVPSPTGCSLPESYAGSLIGTGDYHYQPNGTYYYAGAGTHQGCLRGPTRSNFDLQLLKWSGSAWVTVAQSAAAWSTESISYSGTAGHYIWRVSATTGSGPYTLALKRP